MILIRLKKTSLGNKLSYAVVASSNKVSPKSNKFLEKIGVYKPIMDNWSNKYLYIDFDRFKFWLDKGAQIHPSVFVLLRATLSYHAWLTTSKNLFIKKLNNKN